MLVATLGTARSAPITWGTPTAVGTGPGNSADVSTNGTLVEAYSGTLSDDDPSDQTVNGVTFIATTDLLPSNALNQADMSSTTNSGDAAYDAILSSLDFGGGDSTTIVIGDGDGDTGTLGSGLLTIGLQYEIQVWFVDDRSASDYDTRVMGFASSSGDPVVQLDDQFVIGTFTADGTTQTLFLNTISPSSEFRNTHITAYQIRELSASAPEITVVGTSFVLGTGFQVTFSGLDTGTTYELRRSPDLRAPWLPVAGSATMPTATTDTFTDASATLPGPAFYRLWGVP